MTLPNDHPQAALALLTESSDLVTDDAKRGLISGTAVNDPKLAFQLIGELGLKDTSQAISSIMSAAKTPEERTATLAALRDHLVTLTDEKARNEATARSVGGLTRSLAQEGFASATQWVHGANLSPAELESVAGGLSHSAKSGETGQWIEWIGEKLPPENGLPPLLTDPPRTLPSAPTPRPFPSTNSKPPPGKDRDSTLKRIHDQWPKDDAAAKDAFAKEHGIK